MKGFSVIGVMWRKGKFKTVFTGYCWANHTYLYCQCRVYWWVLLKSYNDRWTQFFLLLKRVVSPDTYKFPSYIKNVTGVIDLAVKAGFSIMQQKRNHLFSLFISTCFRKHLFLFSSFSLILMTGTLNFLYFFEWEISCHFFNLFMEAGRIGKWVWCYRENYPCFVRDFIICHCIFDLNCMLQHSAEVICACFSWHKVVST